ncbi:bile acid-CoA:amino acid N-acyltransferase-like [Protopterus annectens]|uniref:bile acid-CoA:amino acid N-acyltransferase-like n=1 Tax=Protopterus annectens TaxID=7888 RepID=UPI001CFA0781|nr:bile acid-CoA:amino acid N-acyltransferase-like [Protopterus annectens]XP_043943809.1 bile acid-CoA:amino acid N-acyltransferase-like [Protopterus annectens]XP_043943810.1 bile acid-CoA:amino acid N-acyltransferase-like [Protopterus annectens]
MTRVLSPLLAWHASLSKQPFMAAAMQRIPVSLSWAAHDRRTQGPASQRTLTTSQVAPVIVARPTRALSDDKVDIIVENLQPNQPVTLYAMLMTEQKKLFESFAHYVSNKDGTVQVAEDESLGGSYTGCEPMGFIWSLTTAPETPSGLRVRKEDVTTPFIVHVSVFDGHVFERSPNKTALAVIEVERWFMAPGVKRVKVRQNGIVGTLFLPPGPGPFPGVMELWGGAGGLNEFRAALLASHGFATLVVAYTNHPDLPYPNYYIGVSDDYFQEAFHFLQNHHQIAKDRTGILGHCIGQYIALRMEIDMPNIRPRCIVGINGGHYWPVDGKTGYIFEIITKKLMNTQQYTEDNPLCMKPFMTHLLNKPSCHLDVGKIRCPILLFSSEDDQAFAAKETSLDIERKMKLAGNSHLLTRVTYPKTGHLIEPPFAPVTPVSFSPIPGIEDKVWLAWGGEKRSHAHAQDDLWQRTLSFLNQHLVLS